MQSLVIKNLYKSFGKTEVLKGIDIALEEGEFLVLVGPSGCGKSTLLNAIAGLDVVSSGEILFGGNDITDAEPKDRDLAMVFQSYALYPNMTVRENIEFGLKISQFSKQEIESRIKEASQVLHIEQLLERKPSQLSGGQRQRVAIARSISREPSMYLFDEPLSNLDAELRVKMRAEIKKLHKRVKKTMVYVTHDQVEAMTLADKVAVMNNGVIQQLASPAEIFNQPCNLFTAGFMGSPSMNMIDVQIAKEKNQLYFELDNGAQKIIKIMLNNHDYLAPYVNKIVVAGLRPNHIQNGFRDMSLKDELQDVSIMAQFSEMTGSDLFVHTELNQSEVVARVSVDHFVEDGQWLPLKIWVDRILFFDKDTEMRIN